MAGVTGRAAKVSRTGESDALADMNDTQEALQAIRFAAQDVLVVGSDGAYSDKQKKYRELFWSLMLAAAASKEESPSAVEEWKTSRDDLRLTPRPGAAASSSKAMVDFVHGMDFPRKPAGGSEEALCQFPASFALDVLTLIETQLRRVDRQAEDTNALVPSSTTRVPTLRLPTITDRLAPRSKLQSITGLIVAKKRLQTITDLLASNDTIFEPGHFTGEDTVHLVQTLEDLNLEWKTLSLGFKDWDPETAERILFQRQTAEFLESVTSAMQLGGNHRMSSQSTA